MEKFLSILFGFIFIPLLIIGQDITSQTLPPDTVKSAAEIRADEQAVMENYDTMYKPVIDTTRRIYYWRITKRTGEIVPGKPDTLITDFPNRMNVDGLSVAMAYPGNLGLPMESRIFFERLDRSHFMFADPYYNYDKTPEKHNYINTKIPYSYLTYQTAGSRDNREERLQGALSINFGKKWNVGLDVDYIYARGFYTSQSAKRTDWDFYTSYISDRHQLHAFVNPTSYSNGENGGITNDVYITDPTAITGYKVQSREIPVNFQSSGDQQYTWNLQKGMEYYLSYRYNLGFEKDTEHKNEEGETIKRFIPVSSLIYTFNYKDKKRRFEGNDSTTIDSYYQKMFDVDSLDYFGTGRAVNDSTSYWAMSNTFGLSLREGFSPWAKFDLTAFVTLDNRKFTLMKDSISNETKNQFVTYIGGEIAKRTGKILRYEASVHVGLIGNDNLGDFEVKGQIETRIPLLKDTASIIANGYIKNLSPTFYESHFHGKYFWWDNEFEKIKKVFFGGTIDFPRTNTKLKLGVENIFNYLYFDKTGYPKQYKENDESKSIQVLAATIEQNFKLRALHWDNQLVYQKSSEQSIIPLPQFSFYSNLYIQFTAAKVLTIQLGGNVHYFTEYYSPTYEPATQQFRLQDEKKIGNYPIINAYVNCHLKQARFFVEFYNLSASIISPPEYFSLPHYPLNPMIFKLGISFYLNN